MSDGILEPAEGRWTVRFVRRLAHPPERVWRALTEEEHLAHWFPTTMEGPRVAGSVWRFADRDTPGPGFEGELIAFDPPTRLEFSWGGDRLCFSLRPDGEGCVLELTDTFDELGKAARDAAGWHTCLDRLGFALDGETPPWSTRERWSEVHPGYVTRLGPAAATIGPPDGH